MNKAYCPACLKKMRESKGWLSCMEPECSYIYFLLHEEGKYMEFRLKIANYWFVYFQSKFNLLLIENFTEHLLMEESSLPFDPYDFKRAQEIVDFCKMYA